MTITEAHDVATLLTLLGAARPVSTDQVVEAAARLEGRVEKALNAGPRIDPAVVRETAELLTRPEAKGDASS